MTTTLVLGTSPSVFQPQAVLVSFIHAALDIESHHLTLPPMVLSQVNGEAKAWVDVTHETQADWNWR